MKEADKNAFQKFLEEIKEAKNNKEQYKLLDKMLKEVIYLKFDKLKYEGKIFEEDLIEAEKIYEIIKENEQSKQVLGKNRDLVIKQLDIINNILGNPDEVSRIEEYNNPFSKKNYENLNFIAELVEKNKRSKSE